MVGDRCNLQTTAGKWCNFLDAICVWVHTSFFLRAMCVLWNNADAKGALCWRTHQCRGTKKHPVLALWFFGRQNTDAGFWWYNSQPSKQKLVLMLFVGLTSLVPDMFVFRWCFKRFHCKTEKWKKSASHFNNTVIMCNLHQMSFEKIWKGHNWYPYQRKLWLLFCLLCWTRKTNVVLGQHCLMHYALGCLCRQLVWQMN